MAKTYTAQEMREEAKCFELIGGSCTIPAMLRQAADALERDEKRVKKYEYGILYVHNDGSSSPCDRHFLSLYEAKATADLSNDNAFELYRRPVGEWEEVRDGE